MHGISEESVSSEPTWRERLAQIVTFVGNDLLVAHNASFDVGVLRSACALDGLTPPDLRFICTMVLARRLLQLPSYRLPFVAEAVSVSVEHHHEPLSDAMAVVEIVRALASRYESDDVVALAQGVNVGVGALRSGEYSGSVFRAGRPPVRRRPLLEGSTPGVTPDDDGYLADRVVVFTGKLQTMPRRLAWEACALMGAEPQANTTKRTNIVVMGSVSDNVLRPGAKLTAKAQKAVNLRAAGQEIELMTEEDFLRCLDESALALATAR